MTTSFTANWETTGSSAPVANYEIYYQINNGPLQLWQTFAGTVVSAPFPLQQSGLGDGAYGFAAIAIDVNGNRQPAKSSADAILLVDLADRIQPTAFVPTVYGGANASSTSD